MAKSCYMCDEPATSKEHIPPRCFFPEVTPEKDHRKNLIKVPSCEKHNTGKSKDDEYVLCVFLWSIGYPELSTFKWSKNKLDKILAKKGRKALFNKGSHFWGTVGNSPLLVPKTLLEIDPSRFYPYMDKMARGIYFHHYKRKWKHRVIVDAHFLRDHGSRDEHLDPIRRYMDWEFEGRPNHGSNLEIFRYQIMDRKLPLQVNCCMGVEFFSKCRVTMIFHANPMTPN